MAKDKWKLYMRFQDQIRSLKETTGQDPECRNTHDVFFPDDFHDAHTKTLAIKTAKAICNRCPLITHCAEYAIEAEERDGIWGSQTPAERAEFINQVKKIRKRRGF